MRFHTGTRNHQKTKESKNMEMTYETRAELLHATGHAVTETTAHSVAYDQPRKWGDTDNAVRFANLAISAITGEGLDHYAFTYNGGDVLHVFLPETPYEGVGTRSSWAFVVNTTMGSYSAVCRLVEEGQPEGFRVPEGWRRMKASSIEISLGGPLPVLGLQRVDVG